MAKIQISRGLLLMWDKQNQEYKGHYFMALLYNRVNRFYKLNGKLINEVKKMDTELAHKYLDIETIDVHGIPTERVRMTIVPKIMTNTGDAPDETVEKTKEGYTHEDYIKARDSFVNHMVTIEI